jgi:hypothetical protein
VEFQATINNLTKKKGIYYHIKSKIELLVPLTYIYKTIMKMKAKQWSSNSNLFIHCIKNLCPNYCPKIRACCSVKICSQLGPHRFSYTQNEETHKQKTCNSSAWFIHFHLTVVINNSMYLANIPNNGCIYIAFKFDKLVTINFKLIFKK